MGCTPSSQREEPGLKYNCDRQREVFKEAKEDEATEVRGRASLDVNGTHLEIANKDSSIKHQTTLKLGPMCLKMPTIKVLLVFEKCEAQCDVLKLASEKLHHQCTVVYSLESALDSYIHSQPHLIFIDARSSHSLDALAICRSIRNIKGSQSTCIVAVVKKSWAEKDEGNLLSLLKVGFNRWLIESTSSALCLNEIVQIERSEIAAQIKLRAAQALIAALDTSRDGILLTGPSHEVEFVNKGFEKLLGYQPDDLLGRSAVDVHKTDSQKHDLFDSINAHLSKGKEWEGTLFHSRKSGDCVPLWSRIIPVDGHNGVPEHLIYIKEFPYYSVEKAFSPEGDILPYSYGSTKGNRKTSCDVKSLCSESKISSLNRRHSFAKFHTMTIEAPISKVINILMATQENSPVFVAQALEKVLDILRGSELYSPSFTGFQPPTKDDDQVTTDLFTGLIQSTKSTGIRRMSHEQVIQKNSGGPPPTPTQLPSLANIPPGIQNLLESQLEWEFDIMELEDQSNKRPLVWLGLSVLSAYNVCSTLNCDEVTLRNWLQLIEANYRDNPYHNSTHAADVMQATAYFLKKPRLKAILDPLDEAICLLSAIVHDVDHPGKNSAFLCNSKHELAVLYNDISVLESHHSALAFKLTISDESVNIFKNLDRDTYKEVRQSIIDMVLATEMTKHFEHLSKFVNVFTKSLSVDEGEQCESLLETVSENPNLSAMATPENIVLIKRILIKCADVSNPVRPQKLCSVWANRIAEEYCNQTDEEKSLGLPVVMPAFDRTTCNIPRSQIGFIDYFANDMFEAWDAFGDFPELIEYLRTNHTYWERQEKLKASQTSSSDSSLHSKEQEKSK